MVNPLCQDTCKRKADTEFDNQIPSCNNNKNLIIIMSILLRILFVHSDFRDNMKYGRCVILLTTK